MRTNFDWRLADSDSIGRSCYRGWKRFLIAALVASAFTGWSTATARAQSGSIHVAYTPTDTTVSQGGDFLVTIDVTSANTGWDGFDLVLGYDPSALTFLPTNPSSAAQGCLMSGACADSSGNRACGTTPNYVLVRSLADSVYAGDALLCGNVYLTAPGGLFTFHFRASGGPQATHIQVRRATFSTATAVVPGTFSTGPTIHISGTTAVGPSSMGLRMRATPNPAIRAVSFALASENSGDQELSVHDIQGRTVRVLSRGWQPAGERTLMWDGTSASGDPVRPGVYLVTFRAGARRIQDQVTILE